MNHARCRIRSGRSRSLNARGGTVPRCARLLPLAAGLAGVCLLAGPALGAGLILYEINAPTTGTASAGWSALAADASTAFTNPAGMTRLERSQLLVGAQPLIVDTEFSSKPGTTVPGNDGGNAGGVLPSLGGYYVHHLGEKWRLGLSLTSYFGLGLDYDNDWVGRYYAQEGDFITLTMAPSVAYQVTDWLSVGGSVGAVYGHLKAKAALPNLGMVDGSLRYEDSAWGVMGSVGLLFEPCENARFGVTYYSPADLPFEDRPRLSGVGPGLQLILDNSPLSGSKLHLDFTLPQWVMVSAYWQPAGIEKLALMANANWQDWSEFGYVDVNIDSVVDRTINSHYDDTFQVAVGAQYRIAEPWLLMAGFAYDSSPVDRANRSVALPLDQQFRWALGAQYSWSEKLTLGLAYEYIYAGDASVNQSRDADLGGTLVGDYSPNRIQVANVNVIWRF